MCGRRRDGVGCQSCPATTRDEQRQGRFFPRDTRESPSSAWKISHLTPSDKLTSVVLNHCMILGIAQYETNHSLRNLIILLSSVYQPFIMCMGCAKHFTNVFRIDPQRSLSKRVFLLGKRDLRHLKINMGELLVGFSRQTSKNWVLAGDRPFHCTHQLLNLHQNWKCNFWTETPYC